MKLRSGFVALGFALSIALSSQANAVGILDFGVIAPTTGTISYAGGTAPLVGTNIQVDNVVGLLTPLNNGVVGNCVGCVLNFTTGAANPANSWTFGPGGTITITGGIDTTGDMVAEFSGTLLTGSFQGTTTVSTVNGQLRIAGAGFVDTKHEDLTAFYGMPDSLYTGGFNLSFLAAGSTGDAFTSSMVLSGDIVNMPVDLPSSLLLLGSGLVGFAYLSRRRS